MYERGLLRAHNLPVGVIDLAEFCVAAKGSSIHEPYHISTIGSVSPEDIGLPIAVEIATHRILKFKHTIPKRPRIEQRAKRITLINSAERIERRAWRI